jgi:hypothetical protein
MRGAAFLKSSAPAEHAAALALRATKTNDELVSVWWRDCEQFDGEARERLQAIYAVQLRKMGALHG